MANYRIEIARSAEKILLKLPKTVIPSIVEAIQGLAGNPYPAGCRKLFGTLHTYRIRVSVYRIIYEIHTREILVRVLKIGHRKDVYR